MRYLLGFLLVFAVATVASAQQQSIVLGSDTNTSPDGGVLRRVKVDPQGRLVVASTSPDGGTSSTTIVSFQCSAVGQTVTSVGVAASTITVGLANRWYARICNSSENAGTPLVKCRDDAVNPVMGIANAGEVLEVGDCVSYYTTNAIRCISDTAATAVTQAECQ